MQVYIIRHTSVDVAPGTCYGQTDVPLKETFPQEAAVVADKLKGITFDEVFVSPLTRCVRLATYCGYPDAIREKRIIETDFGEWEMKRFDQMTDPRVQLWYNDYINTRATGGESYADQYIRVSKFLDELRTKDYKRVALFCHGGVLMCTKVYFKACTIEEAFGNLPSYGEIFVGEF